MVNKISIAGSVVVVVLLIIGGYILASIPINILSTSTPASIKISFENASIFESLYLWRERLYDTIFQSLVLFAALAGVLIYVVEVRKR